MNATEALRATGAFVDTSVLVAIGLDQQQLDQHGGHYRDDAQRHRRQHRQVAPHAGDRIAHLIERTVEIAANLELDPRHRRAPR